MLHDPIVDEVRKYREEYAAQFDFDLEAMFRDLREKQQAGGRQIVSFVANRVPQRRRSMTITKVSPARLKQAKAETLTEHPHILRNAVSEILDDLGLAEAIRRGKKTKSVPREEIFQLLRKQK